MPCFYPLAARQTISGEIVFKKKTDRHFVSNLQLPCGRCIGCRLERARQWAVRCLHESQLHESNCFLTLTFNDEKESTALEAPRGSLSIRTHQKFMKRLRKLAPSCRFYMCGEYGEKLGRPHYHYLIFGYEFSDKTYLKKSASGENLYTSATLDKIWPYGHAWIGDVTYKSCGYVAAYVMKKITGDKADEHYKRTDEAGNDYWLQPEFNLMSRKPGIARDWWGQFHTDVTTHDAIIQRGGIKAKPPRYYDKLLEIMDPALWQTLKAARESRAKLLADDNTPARLQVKETVQKARVALKTRQLEKP